VSASWGARCAPSSIVYGIRRCPGDCGYPTTAHPLMHPGAQRLPEGSPTRPQQALWGKRAAAQAPVARAAGRPAVAAGAHRARLSVHMKAVVHDRYGPPEVLRLEEVTRPAPRATSFWSGSAPPPSTASTATPGKPTAATASHQRRQPRGLRPAPAAAADPGHRVRGRGSGDRPDGHPVRPRRPRLRQHRPSVRLPRRVHLRPADGPGAPMPAGTGFAEAAAATGGALNALWCLRLAGPARRR
jgi:hypothetical protein